MNDFVNVDIIQEIEYVDISTMGKSMKTPGRVNQKLKLSGGWAADSLEHALTHGDKTFDKLREVINYGTHFNEIFVINTSFRDLRGIPDTGELRLEDNKSLTTLAGIHTYLSSEIWLLDFSEHQHITSSILGLLKTKVMRVAVNVDAMDASNPTSFYNVLAILQKHLQLDRDVIECKEELMNAGLKEFAKL